MADADQANIQPLLNAEPAQVYKTDGRSRVWRVDRPREQGGPVVIKRFEYSPLRQRLADWVGAHPAQRELRSNERLRAAGLPVVPITAHGTIPAGAGCRFWLMTPLVGRSLQCLMRGQPIARGERLRLIQVVADLAGLLIRGGYYFRDFKPSNILIDDAGAAWLIDVGGLQRSDRPDRVTRMLAVMRRKVTEDQLSLTDQLRFLHAVVDQCPQLAAVRQVVAELVA